MANSYLAKTRASLDAVCTGMDALLDASAIRRLNINLPGDSVVFITAAEFGWVLEDDRLAGIQMDLLTQIDTLAELICASLTGLRIAANPRSNRRLKQWFGTLRAYETRADCGRLIWRSRTRIW